MLPELGFGPIAAVLCDALYEPAMKAFTFILVS